MMVTLTRWEGNPIIHPGLDPSIGRNINGPSLIRMPAGSEGLGRYHLYFSDHAGKYIRLAYAQDLRGPWRIHQPGVLHVNDTPCKGHIASPDVHLLGERQIIMYFHGPIRDRHKDPPQRTFAAVSEDGLHFKCLPQDLGRSYFRRFDWGGQSYGIAMPGELYRSDEATGGFQARPGWIAEALMPAGARYKEQHRPRHFAVQVRGDSLRLFFSRVGDAPEHLLMAKMALTRDWLDWRPGRPKGLLWPEQEWEGALAPKIASRPSAVKDAAWQLRDPAIFEEAGRTYLLYAVAGESGIAIAELHETSA